MQTFLPYPSFKASVECLDTQRLGKQRVEVLQILNALSGRSKGWVNHPATKMWLGYEAALIAYGLECCLAWKERGYTNNISFNEYFKGLKYTGNPPWLGNEEFHKSHQSNLLRKFPEYYSRYGWDVEDNLPYVWPV